MVSGIESIYCNLTIPKLDAITYLKGKATIPGFFLTPPAEKTKTQGQNSSKKLKKKTQPLGGLFLPYAKLKEKTKIPEIFSSKLKIFKGVALFIPFLLTNIFKNRKN